MPSRSKSTSHGSNPARALAITNTRRRRWARPKYWASRILHAAVRLGPYTQPASFHLPPGGWSSSDSPTRAARKQPKAFSLSERTPGTFSHQAMHSGSLRWVLTRSIASMVSTNLMVRAPRGSVRPSRQPATLKAWHGVPAIARGGSLDRPCEDASDELCHVPMVWNAGVVVSQHGRWEWFDLGEPACSEPDWLQGNAGRLDAAAHGAEVEFLVMVHLDLWTSRAAPACG